MRRPIVLDALQAGAGPNFIHPADLEEHHRRWRTVLASGDPTNSEGCVRRANGEYRWMLHLDAAAARRPGRSFGGSTRASTSRIPTRARGDATRSGSSGRSSRPSRLRLDRRARWRARVHHRELVRADGSRPAGRVLGWEWANMMHPGGPRSRRAEMAGVDRHGRSPRSGNRAPATPGEVPMDPGAGRSAPRRRGAIIRWYGTLTGHRRPQTRGAGAARTRRSNSTRRTSPSGTRSARRRCSRRSSARRRRCASCWRSWRRWRPPTRRCSSPARPAPEKN